MGGSYLGIPRVSLPGKGNRGKLPSIISGPSMRGQEWNILNLKPRGSGKSIVGAVLELSVRFVGDHQRYRHSQGEKASQGVQPGTWISLVSVNVGPDRVGMDTAGNQENSIVTLLPVPQEALSNMAASHGREKTAGNAA